MAHVMIIDDDVVMCDMLSGMVHMTGHEAASAHTLVEDLMSTGGSNIREACRISGLSRPRPYALMKKYRISRYG